MLRSLWMPGDRRVVDVDIRVRGSLPRIVDAHSITYQGLPLVRPAVRVDGAAHGVEQIAGVVGPEDEAGVRRAGWTFVHRVDKAAGAAHDRDCAIAHRDHLSESTRLEARRHQEHI